MPQPPEPAVRENPPCLTITPVGPDGFEMLIEYTEPSGYVVANEIVDLNPSPTWPSPSETSDAIVDAVRRVWDAAYTYYSGEVIER